MQGREDPGWAPEELEDLAGSPEGILGTARVTGGRPACPEQGVPLRAPWRGACARDGGPRRELPGWKETGLSPSVGVSVLEEGSGLVREVVLRGFGGRGYMEVVV